MINSVLINYKPNASAVIPFHVDDEQSIYTASYIFRDIGTKEYLLPKTGTYYRQVSIGYHSFPNTNTTMNQETSEDKVGSMNKTESVGSKGWRAAKKLSNRRESTFSSNLFDLFLQSKRNDFRATTLRGKLTDSLTRY